MDVGADTAVVVPPSPEPVVASSTKMPLDTETVAAPASEEASGPVVVEDGENGLAPPAAVASSAAVVSSDETSGKEDTAEVAPPVEELPEDTKAALVKQVEFYFSDENLPTDAFMKKKVKAGGAQGWVPLKVICSFPKVKKLSKDIRAIALALEDSQALVVAKATRVRRKTPFKFPDKDGMADVTSRTVVAVNIPAESTVESLTPFFSSCGVAELIRVIHKSKTAGTTKTDNRSSGIQAPAGPNRDLYATCQFSTLEEAIRAVNELTDRKSWRGGLRVSLANGVTVEKALAKLKAASIKKAKQEQKQRVNSRSPVDRGQRNVRDGQMRSRSLTELELERTAGANGGASSRGGGKPRNPRENQHHDEHEASPEDEGSSGDGGEAAPTTRKPRSVSNVDALFSSSTGGRGGGIENGSPPRHTMGSAGDGLPRKGVVQTLSSEGWSWIKKDGQGSRKSGNRIPFVMGDVVTKDGEQRQPLQKGDHVEYRVWKDTEGRSMAVRVERAKERPRPAGGGVGSGSRSTQAHFRMAVGPEEGKSGFVAGRGRPIVVAESSPNEVLRRPRGSSMGGADSKVFVPSAAASVAAEAAAAAAAAAAAVAVAAPSPQQFEDAD
ncbi:unnamed protein product [Ectocarpus sp. 6 AP-2014]